MVAPGDTVWHPGDVACRLKQVAPLVEQLNGTKHLITGNNDPNGIADLPGCASIAAYAELALEGRALVLCHYPFRS